MSLKFEEIPYKMEQVGSQLAEARAEYEFLSEMRKVVLAQEASKQHGSEIAKDRIARTTEVYITHLEWIKEAQFKYLKLQTMYEALQSRFEWFRSQNANRRAEMQLQ